MPSRLRFVARSSVARSTVARSVARSTAVLFGFGLLCVWNASAETSRSATDAATGLTSGLIRYDVPGGETIFALSLRAGQQITQDRHDHVILVDTSASQTGAHRQQATQVLEACLASLDQNDRVRLFALDTQVKNLTAGFFGPQSAEVKQGLAKLQGRVPLGATSLQPALDVALKSFAETSTQDRARSIIYIGDGMSTGKLVDMQEFRTLISQLRSRHIPFNSFAVGPRTDLQVLGVLSQQTGGVVFVDALGDDARQSAQKLGQKLAKAADAPVFYPESISLVPEADKLLPGMVPPIRSDRETILLGKGRLGDVLKVTATGELGPGKMGSLAWSVKPAAAQPGNTFLAGLWNMAEQSDGLLVAVAGSELMNEARQEYEGQVQELVAQGRQAVAKRDLKQAEQIAHAIRQIDPANVQAEAILNASQKVKAVTVALARMQNEEVPDAPAAGIAGDEAPATAKNAALLDDERDIRAIRAQRLAKEIARTIDATNKSGSSDPESALGALKRALTTVIASNDIDPDIREKLRGRLQTSIERLLAAKDKIEMDKIAGLEKASAIRAREMATEQLVIRDEQLEQLISKVSSLMYEGYIGNPDAFERAEEVARASFELAPYAGVTSAAIFDAEAAGQLDKAQRLRYRRYDMFLAQLHQCEMAHIPFPDEPPIVYPAPEVWKSLTERRQKWASVDLMRWNPTEDKIRRSLDKPTNVEFLDLALEDCIQYLKEYHGINIWMDKQTLTDEGVALDQPITLKLAGVSLRSVLKLLLEPVQLTYVIETEVMKITTSTKAGEKLSTRVYPVGDLVIPIITPRAGGGGMGMMGGMGGGMGGGGMGGGMGGGGMGGGMGGGGMGGGMGMMNVADPVSDADGDFNNDTVKNRKKKALAIR